MREAAPGQVQAVTVLFLLMAAEHNADWLCAVDSRRQRREIRMDVEYALGRPALYRPKCNSRSEALSDFI